MRTTEAIKINKRAIILIIRASAVCCDKSRLAVHVVFKKRKYVDRNRKGIENISVIEGLFLKKEKSKEYK